MYRSSLFRRVAALAAVAMIATACGGDDDGDDAPTETAAGGDSQAFCQALVDIESTEPDVDFESATPEEMEEATKVFFSDAMIPQARAIQEMAPEDLKDNVETIIGLFESNPTFELFESEEFLAAEEDIDRYVASSCGDDQVAVTGTEYAFEVGGELTAGKVAIDFKNEGAELHEMVILRKNGGVTESWDELLELPEEESMQKAAFVAAGFAPPAADDAVLVDLEAGEHIMICFVPVGATADVMQGGEEPEGPPHFTQGMRHEFTVG